MNGASGFREVRSSTSRSPSYRLLYEQQPQVGTGFWHLFRTHDLIALSTGISTKREMIPDTTPLTLSVLGASYLLLSSSFEQENIPRLGFPLQLKIFSTGGSRS